MHYYIALYFARSVRNDLHRTIYPVDNLENPDKSVSIMWSSMRTDMQNEHWIPNHSVPLVHQIDLLGKYVVITYDDECYPGQVLAVDGDEIEVNCMSKAGYNRFYWPKRSDECWYKHEKIMAVIPPPIKGKSRHYQVSPDIWNSILS